MKRKSTTLYSAQYADLAEVKKNPGGRHSLILSSGQRVDSFHNSTQCWGDVCPVHNPSSHELRSWPLAFSGRHMVRINPHVAATELRGMLVSQYSDEPVEITIDPDDYFFKIEDMAILRNSSLCLSCGEHLESYDRPPYDRVSCKCDELTIWGGLHKVGRNPQQGRSIDTSLIFYPPTGGEVGPHETSYELDLDGSREDFYEWGRAPRGAESPEPPVDWTGDAAPEENNRDLDGEQWLSEVKDLQAIWDHSEESSSSESSSELSAPWWELWRGRRWGRPRGAR